MVTECNTVFVFINVYGISMILAAYFCISDMKYIVLLLITTSMDPEEKMGNMTGVMRPAVGVFV